MKQFSGFGVAKPMFLVMLALSIGCGAALEDEGVAPFDEGEVVTQQQELSNVSVTWQPSMRAFLAKFHGIDGKRFKVCVKRQDQTGNPCNHTELWWEVGHGDYEDAHTFFQPNRKLQRFGVVTYDACGTWYEFRIKTKGAIGHHTRVVQKGC